MDGFGNRSLAELLRLLIGCMPGKSDTHQHCHQLCGRKSQPDSRHPEEWREQVGKEDDQDESTEHADQQGVSVFEYRLEIADEDHVDAHQQKACKINSDRRRGKSQDAGIRIQEDVSKQVRNDQAQQYRNGADNQRRFDRKGTDFVHARPKARAVIGGKDRLCRLIDAFAQACDYDCRVADHAENTDTGVSRIFQQLQVKHKNGQAGSHFDEKAGEAVDRDIPQKSRTDSFQ